MIFWIFVIKCTCLSINVLFEKIVRPELEMIYKGIIEHMFKEYNKILEGFDITLEVEEAMSHSKYSQLPEYKELQKYGGSEYLSNRMEAILNIRKNILVIASSQIQENDIYFNIEEPCIAKYITTFDNYDNVDLDDASAIKGAVERYLSKLFNTKIPNVFGIVSVQEIKHFISVLKKNRTLTKFTECNRIAQIYNKNVDFTNELSNIGKTIPEDFDNNIENTILMNNDSLPTDKIVITEDRKNTRDEIEKSTIKNEKPAEEIVKNKTVKKRKKKHKQFQYLTRP